MSLIDSFLRWFGPGGFSGVTFGVWMRVLWANRFAIDPVYLPRAAIITAVSVQNSCISTAEQMLLSGKVRRADVQPPLLVLGVWRSGTTHLQNLLAADARFATPNFYQVIYPQTFLLSEAAGARVMSLFLPERRFQDNVKFGAGEPSEDEAATMAMTGRSMLMSLAFPRNARFYDRLLTFREATEKEVSEWGAALNAFVRKLSCKYAKPLVLKSPGHTGRIRLLLDLFPGAKFVHIHRHPYDVFRSTEHTLRKLAPYWALQRSRASDEAVVESILRQYQELCDAYFQERDLIPDGRLCELAYDELAANPLGELARVYQELDLPDFSVAAPALENYVRSLAGYRKNKHAPLPDDLRERIAARWRRSFDEWGYNI